MKFNEDAQKEVVADVEKLFEDFSCNEMIEILTEWTKDKEEPTHFKAYNALVRFCVEISMENERAKIFAKN